MEEQFMMNNPNETKIVRLVKEGGTNLMSLLLNQAIKPSSSEFLIPVHYKKLHDSQCNNKRHGTMLAVMN